MEKYFRFTLLVTLILANLTVIHTNAHGAGFFDRKNEYKGFYWFDDQSLLNNKQEKKPYQMPSAEEASDAIDERKKGLDDARNQMMAVSFDKAAPNSTVRDSIIAYKKLELDMWDGALRLASASEMANFTNPELADNSEQPTNVFGVKLKRKLDAKQAEISIMEFAQDFDLLLFASDSCPYCKSFIPVVNHFVAKHKFALDITTLDGKAGKLASSLGIKAVPTLIAVKKDGTQIFEVSRGMLTASGLANNINLAHNYSQELSQKQKKSRRKAPANKVIKQYRKNTKVTKAEGLK